MDALLTHLVLLMELSQLCILVRVVEPGSISRAAMDFNQAQSAFSGVRCELNKGNRDEYLCD